MNEKKENIDWKRMFFIILCVISLIMSIVSLFISQSSLLKANNINSKLEYHNYEDYNTEDALKTNTYMEFCETLNNRMDYVFGELLTIVGIFITIITILGILITFKAPKDIERKMENLQLMLEGAQSNLEEQEYILEIFSALNEETTYHRIRALDEIIENNPGKYQAYLRRGCLYDTKGDYDSAISDYKMAHKLGWRKKSYYNNMSVSLSNRGSKNDSECDLISAIEYISKAIEIDSENANYYLNRGTVYSDLKKYENALADYDKALSIDPKSYEACSNKAELYLELMDVIDTSKEEIEMYRNNAISYINKAMDLNKEDAANLKQLERMIKDKFESKIQEDTEEETYADEDFDNILLCLNERLGDISREDEDYIEAINEYTEALELFYDIAYENINEYFDTINRICFKILECKQKMPAIDINESINRRLEIFIINMEGIAFNYYMDDNFEMASKLFIDAVIVSGFGTSSANNLAYMIRRGECVGKSPFTIMELLSCKSPDDSSSFLRINRAFCYIQGIGYEKNFEDALKEIKICESELAVAFDWWINNKNAGEKEANLVEFLLILMKKYRNENADIHKLMEQAINDGYDIPFDAEEIAEKVLNTNTRS